MHVDKAVLPQQLPTKVAVAEREGVYSLQWVGNCKSGFCVNAVIRYCHELLDAHFVWAHMPSISGY